MLGKTWQLAKASVIAFNDDNALSRGAAIAFYAITSLAPVLVVVIAIAGLAFGEEAAHGAISAQLSGLMGQKSAEVIEAAIQSASLKSSGAIATALGMLTLLVTVSGVFGEIQSTLNAFWRVEPKGTTVSRLVRARAASLGLVATLGFLLMISLVISALLKALDTYVGTILPFGDVLLEIINFVISFVLIALLFAAIYKVLPDVRLRWRDVTVGAVTTAFLFMIGKSLIGIYLGSSAVGSSYGAASSLLVVLLWIYYSVQIFLLGAEFTKVYASTHGGQQVGHVPTPEAAAQNGDLPVAPKPRRKTVAVEPGEEVSPAALRFRPTSSEFAISVAARILAIGYLARAAVGALRRDRRPTRLDRPL